MLKLVTHRNTRSTQPYSITSVPLHFIGMDADIYVLILENDSNKKKKKMDGLVAHIDTGNLAI